MAFTKKVAGALRAEGFRLDEKPGLPSWATKRITGGKYEFRIVYEEERRSYWFNVASRRRAIHISFHWGRFYDLLRAMNEMPEEVAQATRCALENISSNIIDYMEGRLMRQEEIESLKADIETVRRRMLAYRDILPESGGALDDAFAAYLRNLVGILGRTVCLLCHIRLVAEGYYNLEDEMVRLYDALLKETSGVADADCHMPSGMKHCAASCAAFARYHRANLDMDKE